MRAVYAALSYPIGWAGCIQLFLSLYIIPIISTIIPTLNISSAIFASSLISLIYIYYYYLSQVYTLTA